VIPAVHGRRDPPRPDPSSSAPCWPRPCGSCGVETWPGGTPDVPVRHVHHARGLCCRCYKGGRVDHADHERASRSRDELLTEWEHLRYYGLDWRQAAQRLGMTYPAFERAMLRARRDGDPRAVRPGEQAARIRRFAVSLSDATTDYEGAA
jgi:hypothetical protein